MDAQTIQRQRRLQRAFALAVVGALVGLGACARGLKSQNDFVGAPQDLEQKIERLSPEELAKIAEAAQPKPVFLGQVNEVKEAPAVLPVAAPVKKEKKKKESKSAAPAASTWQPAAWPYTVGEELTYTLRWGVLEGGVASVKVEEPVVIDGEPVLHYRGRVHSSKMLELFYKIDDSMDTWVGLNDHLPRRQEMIINESKRFGKRLVVFDQSKQVARFYSSITKETGEVDEQRRDDAVLDRAQDIFGGFYFYRFAPKLEGLKYPIHDRWNNWTVEFVYVGREDVRVPSGRFKAQRYRVNPRLSGSLESRGDVNIWFSDDAERLPLKFEAKVKIGSIVGELKEFKRGGRFTAPVPQMQTPLRSGGN